MRVATPFLAALALAGALLSAGCGGRDVAVVGSATDLHLSGNWNDADSRAVAEQIIPECLRGPWLERFQTARGRAPVVRVGHVNVRVQDLDDVIEPDIISEDLVRAMLGSGRIKAVASREEAEQVEGTRETRVEMAAHAAAGQVPAQGQETAADFLLSGVIASQDDQVRDVNVGADVFRRVKFYQITLRLTDVATNEVVWSGSAERKKVIEQSSISF